MNLQDGDYIVSVHPLEETWALVIDAISRASAEKFIWDIVEDRMGQRLSATMQYQKTLRLKRNLLLEINFFPLAPDRVRLELHYTISPLFNIKQPEEIIDKTVSMIAQAVLPGAVLYSRSGKLPAELASVEQKAEGRGVMLTAFEIVLALNLILVILAAIGGAGSWQQSLLTTVTAFEINLGVLIGLIILFGWGGRGVVTLGRGGQSVLVWTLAAIGGVFMCIFVVGPIILFGLCLMAARGSP
jgi:hypothetical protein